MRFTAPPSSSPRSLVTPAETVSDAAMDGKVKRKLALHLGYVGTDYRGACGEERKK